MNRHMRRTALPAAVVGLALAVPAAPASAQSSAHPTGPEHFQGILVVSGTSGHREIVSTAILARGVFDGFGRIVEVPNRPGDPDNVSRDNLVFGRGSFHLVSVTVGGTFSVDKHTCRFHATARQQGRIVGGTGRFRAAHGTFTGRVEARGVMARAADGSCSQDRAPLREVDLVSGSGILTL